MSLRLILNPAAMLCVVLAACSGSTESSESVYLGNWAALSVNSPGFCTVYGSDGCAFYQNVTIASDGSFAAGPDALVASFVGTVAASGQVSGTVVWADGAQTSRSITGTCGSQSYCSGTITGGTWQGGAATFYFQRSN
jgi:hypothetical protein